MGSLKLSFPATEHIMVCIQIGIVLASIVLKTNYKKLLQIAGELGPLERR